MDFYKRFEEEKKRLNDEQLLAVETTEGPVLTIAGPGTGKTQVLAIRIGELLNKTVGLSPYNILCLTYTDAAAHNMRQRLLSFIGADAYKIRICTYHAFCSQIIKEYPGYFSDDEGQKLKPIDNLAYLELMEEFIQTMDASNPLKKFSGDRMSSWRSYQELFREMEKESLSEDFLRGKIDEYIDFIRQDTSNKTFFYQRKTKDKEIGDPKDKLKEEVEQKERLKLAVGEKKRFDALLKEKGYCTFEQMILFVIDAFRKYPDLLSTHQEQFQYFLVDEYQDTNGSQNELLSLLCQFWGDKANVFIVGDDDQSIFRFQGANTENIIRFKEKYKANLAEIRLSKNYRSAQNILDCAELFIRKNTDRLLADKRLQALNKAYQDEGNKAVVLCYANTLQEELGIALRIKELVEAGVNPSEIAVLYKKHAHSERIEKLLQQYEVPYELRSSADILKEKLISDLLDILTYMAKESVYPGEADDLLFHILHFNFFRLSPLFILSLYQKKANSRKNKSFRQIIADASEKDASENEKEEARRLKKISDELERLLSDIHQETIQRFVQKAVYQLGILSFAQTSPERIWLLEALYSFFDFIKMETDKEPFKPLSFFIDRIELYRKQREPISAYKMIKKQESVKLMTIFSSKGLEFEYVFIIKTIDDNWEKAKKPPLSFRLPSNLFHHSGGEESEQAFSIRELRRLFYVAITRAKKSVYISFSQYAENKKDLQMSVFVSEIIETGKTNVSDINAIPTEEIKETEQLRSLAFLLSPPSVDEVEIELINIELIKEKLADFELSASSLKQYLDCPLGFYYSSVLRLPRASSPDQSYGKSAHYALNRLYPDARKGESGMKSKEDFLSIFEREMKKHRSSFTEKEFSFYMNDRGKRFLSLFYDQYINDFKKERVTQNEYPIHLTIEGVPLFGILDKLVFAGNNVRIYDYKTGSFSKSSKETKRFSPPTDTLPAGGDYWRQGAFYKLLVDHIYLKRPDKKWKTERVVFQYIEREHDELFYEKSFQYEDGQIEHLKKIIIDVWKKIQALEFSKGCGKKDCSWCALAKERYSNPSQISWDENEDE